MPVPVGYSRFAHLLTLRERLTALCPRRPHPRPGRPNRLVAEVLEDRLVPDGRPLPLPVIYAGAGEGMTPTVKAYAADTGVLNFERTVFEPGFTGGVRVAVADFTADGYPDVVVSPGGGGGPRLRVLDGKTGDQIPGPLGSFWAFDESFTGGVHVAAADVDGDGTPDVVTAAGPGGGPHVKVFSGATGAEIASFFALDSDFDGGITVAAADLTGDGRAEIAVGAGVGGGPRVKVYDPTTWDAVAGPLGSFFAFDPSFQGGVYVGADALAGDYDSDGTPDLAVGSGAGMAGTVKVLSGATGAVLRDFQPFGPGMTNGVRVALAYVDDDEFADVVAGTGPGGPATVRVFSGATGDQLPSPIGEYAPFGAGTGSTGGVYLAASNDPFPIYLNNLYFQPTVCQYDSLDVMVNVFGGGYDAEWNPYWATGTVTFTATSTTTSAEYDLGTGPVVPTLDVPGEAGAQVTSTVILPLGTYTITASYSGDGAFLPGEIVSETTLEVVDCEMPPPPSSIGDYVWYDANRDGFQDEGEAPAPGVSVALTGDGLATPLTATTDGEGHYQFSGLAAGGYTVTFTKPTGYEFSFPSEGATTVALGIGEAYTGADAGLIINHPPVAVDDSGTYAGDALPIGVLDNDTDQDGDPLTVTSWTQPTGGEVILVGSVLQYTPSASFAGTDTFYYTISDGYATDTATVTVTVPPRVAVYWDADAYQYSAAAGGLVQGAFRFERTGSTDNSLDFGYGVDSVSTAVSGVDYDTLSGSAVFAPGDAVTYVPVVPTGVVMPDPVRTVHLTVSPGGGYLPLTAAASALLNILQDDDTITVTMRYEPVIPVNANNDNGSPWVQGNTFIPTIRDFDKVNLTRPDPQLIAASVTVTGGGAGQLSFTLNEPGDARVAFWMFNQKTQSLSDFLALANFAAGQPRTIPFYIEGRHESMSEDDRSLVTWTFTPQNPNVQAVSSIEYGIKVAPILSSFWTTSPTPSVSFRDPANGDIRFGIRAGQPGVGGANDLPGITVNATVRTGGLSVSYVQNQTGMLNGPNAGGPGMTMVNPASNRNFVIDPALNVAFPILDNHTGAMPLVESTTTAPLLGGAAVNIRMKDSPQFYFANMADNVRISLVDYMQAFRTYVVVRYSDGSIYSIAYINWFANFYATNYVAGRGVTVIDPASAVVADQAYTKSNTNPQTSGPIANRGITLTVVP